ncbi:MAG TPA: hypothetical protein PKY35_06515 [Candidatus Hydrogenedentes bacterium]|nr:hypothetical protein [Candidatus Hydrogenedentota bacterium]HOL76667.1 hypothetical protein [Candidatus Hydrogenedentota bacterium]HPO84500.1 hypothetical protein [Candidatus Hydrogenedentota bacterium]
MRRWKIRKLMVAALYGELSEGDKAVLEQQLSKSRMLREEYDNLRAVVSALPTGEKIDPPVDLFPLVMARLQREMKESQKRFLRLSFYAVPLAAVILMGIGFLLWRTPNTRVSTHVAVLSQEQNSLLFETLREALALKAQGDDVNAAVALQTALETHPNDALAGQAQMELANLYFERLKRYREAYEAYRLLKSKYPRVFASNHQNTSRLDLLEECSQEDFAALHLLDAARTRLGPDLAALEEVVARYPGTQVASLALQEMLTRVMEESAPTDHQPLHALEALKDRCTNPVTVAQINLEMGKAYWKEYQDWETAERLGQQAMQSENPQIVAMAQTFLQELKRYEEAENSLQKATSP